MAVAEGAVGELDRHRRRAVRVEPAPAAVADPRGELVADEPRQVVVQHDPLQVPAQRAAGLLEHVAGAVLAQAVDEPVVRAQEGDMELGDRQVDVVARIADQRDALGVARQVGRRAGVVAADQHPVRVVALDQVRLARRAEAVDALEVEPRDPRVAERADVGARRERAAIGGQVVREELREHRPAGGALRIGRGARRVAVDERRRRAGDRLARRARGRSPRRPAAPAGPGTCARTRRRRPRPRPRGRGRGSDRGPDATPCHG